MNLNSGEKKNDTKIKSAQNVTSKFLNIFFYKCIVHVYICNERLNINIYPLKIILKKEV